MSVSRAKFTNDAVKKPRARIKKSPTPYSCGTSKYAVTKATMTSIDVMMALIVAKRIDLFSSPARRLRRGISDFNCALLGVSSPIAFNACDLSVILFMRESMMAAARILLPHLQGVAVLGGWLSRDPYRLGYLVEIPALAGETELTNLTGLPLAAQVARARTLPDKTAILYTSLFIDDEGTRYSASDALTTIAKAANRLIVVDVE